MNDEVHSTEPANDSLDDVASLLLGDDTNLVDDEADDSPDTDNNNTEIEEKEDADQLSDDSTDSDSEESDDDQTLQQMLGIDDSQIDVNDDGSILINVKVDGKESQHSLAEVIKNYQLESSTTNKSKALSEEKKAFENAAAAKAQELKNTLEQNANLTGVLEQELMSEYEGIDWEDLRKFDPAEWTAKRQEFGAKYQKIQQVKNEIGVQAQQIAAAQTEQQAAQKNAYLQSQWNTMLDRNPNWKDNDTYKKDMKDIKSFASETYGFKDEDFDNVMDARAVEVLKDAMLYRKGAKVADKKLKKVPKIQRRGGVRKGSKLSKAERLAKAAKTARGSNKRGLETDAVAALLMGG